MKVYPRHTRQHGLAARPQPGNQRVAGPRLTLGAAQALMGLAAFIAKQKPR